ncbi:MAG: FecR family protein [Desulfobacca sp.]|nr:FecR family protein [Desulfobacca sp.]
MIEHGQGLRWHRVLWSCLVIIITAAQGVSAQDRQPAAEIIALTGQAEIKTPTDQSFKTAQLRAKLYPRDQIRTLAKSKAKLWCQDESVLILGENTTLEIAQYLIDEATGQRQSLLRTLTGKLRFVVHKFYKAPEPDYTIETPMTIIGVRGTDGVVEIATGDQVYLLEATKPLSLKNKTTGEMLDLKPMNFAICEAHKAFQVKPITPAIYQRLTQEFQLSHDTDPENLVQPPPPLEAGVEPGKPATILPPVDQAPFSVIHPGSKRTPRPSPPHPHSPPSSY